MNLTIKDLSASLELDRKAMTAVHGGANSNSAVQSIFQAQDVMVPVANDSHFGMGSATNIDVKVDAYQNASNYSRQRAGDVESFGLWARYL